MTVFLDSTGFKPKTLVELRQELEASYRAVWGSTVDLSPEGPLGQHIALMSKRDADLWEGAQEIYTSRDPDQATGEALDNIAAEIGLARLAPTAARADGVICWLPLATAVTVPAGSKIKAANATPTYSLESDVVGTSGASDAKTAFRLKIQIADGDTMSATIGGTAYYSAYDIATHVSVQNFVDTIFAPDVLAGIAGSTCRYVLDNGIEYVEFLFPSALAITAATSLLRTSDSRQGVPGNFVADTPGATTVPENYLDTIATPITNWMAVSQFAPGTDGTDTETDTALRLRRLRAIRSGASTEDAIYNAIMRVANVAYAKVVSNRALDTDTEGRPGKSLECVVQGGETQAIATAIWKTAPAGIYLHGNQATVPTVIGADGLPHAVNFSTPVAKYAHVKVTVQQRNGEEPSPSDLISAIKDAILAWGAENMGLGDNMILQKFYGPVYSVPSIQLVQLEHAITATEGGSFTWTTTPSISFASREYAKFTRDNVEVVLA